MKTARWLRALMPALAGTAAAALPIAPVTRPGPVDFHKEVYPILKANCIACHNKTTTKGDLNMETPELMRKGGESGEGLVAGKGAESLILQAAAHDWDSRMPPKGNKVGAVDLKPEELGLLKLWIDQGAKVGKADVREVAWRPLAPSVMPVLAVAITRDGRHAACSRGSKVFVYEMATQTLVATLEGHRDLVQCLDFSPDGTRLAAGGYREVRIWRREDPQPVHGKQTEPPPPAPPADAAKITEILAKVSKQPGWEAGWKITCMERDASAAAFAATVQTEVMQKAEAEIKALDDRIKKAQDAKAASAKSLDEKRKAVQAAKDALTPAGQELKTAKDALAAAPKDKPDPTLEKKVKEAGTKQQDLEKKLAEAEVALNRAERVITDADAEIKITNENKAAAQKAAAVAKAAIEAAKAAKDKGDKDIAAARKAATEQRKPVKVSALSPDGMMLATAHDDGLVYLWSAATGKAMDQARIELAGITSLAWKDAGTVQAAGADGALWSRAVRGRWTPERVLGGGSSSVITDRANAVRFSPDGALIAVGSGEASRSGDVSMWNAADGKLVADWRELHRDSVLSLDFTADRKQIATGGADRAARIVDAATGKVKKTFEGHTHHVLGISWRADGRVLATAGADNVVKTWDVVIGDRKKSIDGWDKEVTAVIFTGAADQMAATSGDASVKLLRDSGAQVRAFSGASDFLQSAAATWAGDVVVAGGLDGVLRSWDASTGKELVVMKP